MATEKLLTNNINYLRILLNTIFDLANFKNNMLNSTRNVTTSNKKQKNTETKKTT